MTISSKIKTGRTKAGLSQRDLAKRLRKSAAAIAQWETGATSPTIANRVDLSRVLDIPFVELVPELTTQSASTGTTDPVILAIVQQLLKLPEPVRQALLMSVAATADALGDRKAE